MLEDTRRQALDRLVQNATLLGANAILSMRFDSSELASTMSEIVAYGTAVIVDPGRVGSSRHRRVACAARAASGACWPRPSAILLVVGGLTTVRAIRRGGGRGRRLARRRRVGAGRRRRDRALALPFRDGRARRPSGRPRRRRADRGADREPLPAHRRGLRRPDQQPPDAGLARRHERRAAVSRRGLSSRQGSERESPESGRSHRRAILAGPDRLIAITTFQEPDPSDGGHRTRRSRPTGDRGPPAPRPSARAAPFPYLNRELSWLEFNARVLFEARDERNALLERVKFLAIFAGNLDEFFQVRIAGLRQQVEAGKVARSPDGRTAEEQLGGRPGACPRARRGPFVELRVDPPRARRRGHPPRRLRRRSPSTTRRSASASSTRSFRS